jgi:hypothetical protein
VAKTPDRPTAKRTKPGGKPANAKKSKPATAKVTKKAAAQERLEAEREAFYRANQQRIDDALAKCVKHFADDEPDIVRAVGRMLFDYYTRNRMKITSKGSPGGQ